MSQAKPYLLCAALLVTGCTSTTERKEAEQKAAPVPEKKAEAEVVKVRLSTTKGEILLAVHPDWAPLGAARFLELVKAKYFDNSAFFRVVPNFVIQFGLAADPAVTKKWDKPFKDDPVIRTNRVGSLSFATAGPNTRTTQIFINLRSNQMLDSQGFAPFAEITEGMPVVEKIFAGHGELPDQEQITKRGNAYLKDKFPNLDYIRSAVIVE
jgi:cyclophilin family peptidyl-prolyl cis-trans isomerase